MSGRAATRGAHQPRQDGAQQQSSRRSQSAPKFTKRKDTKPQIEELPVARKLQDVYCVHKMEEASVSQDDDLSTVESRLFKEHARAAFAKSSK